MSVVERSYEMCPLTAGEPRVLELLPEGLGHEELTATQRDYLDHLDDYLSADDDRERRASRTRMDRALGAMLGEARVTMAGGRPRSDLIADLGAVVSRTRSATA
jgi:hypothetical protein